MNLILFEAAEVDPFGRVRVGGVRAKHLCDVLGVTPGSPVRVGIVDGPRGTGIVQSVAGSEHGSVWLQCEFEPQAPERPRVDVLLALPRPKVMRRLWAQLAALGVGRIFVTNAERVERNYFDTHVLSPACYRPLLIEGLQQARDTRLPEVTVHRQFRVLVEDDLDGLSPDTTRIVADPSGKRSIESAIGKSAPTRVLLAVGPEGGWNQFEIDLLKSRRFEPVGMGPRTLRSDTACIALLTLTHAALES